MYKFDSHTFQMPKQLRARKTLQDIAESTEILIRSEDIESFTAEKLSALSGYSAGGIGHYFKKREDIFVHLFMSKRKQKYDNVAKIIRAHSPYADIRTFITSIIDSTIRDVGRYRLKVLQFMLQTYFNRAKNPETFDLIVHLLVDDWMHAINKDQTNTFDLMDKDELIINIKSLIIAIRSPFFEGDSIAGSERHRKIAINIGIKIFGKNLTSDYLLSSDQ